MALGITDSKYYSEIASAIRAITAGTETYKPREMANQINVDIAAAKSSISNALVNKGISPPKYC